MYLRRSRQPAPRRPAERTGTQRQEHGRRAFERPHALRSSRHLAGSAARLLSLLRASCVFPLDWSEEGHRHWRIILRCPECESRREGIFEQAAVERLEDELDRAAAALLGDLRRVTHANMSDEIEFFVRALDADLIVPSDF